MIEMVVVMALIGLLLSIALPRYLETLERGRAAVLAHNLAQLRQAIDQYYGDRGAYPDRLEDLVERRYLRALPPDPYTGVADWLTISPPPDRKGAVFDVQAPPVVLLRQDPADEPGSATDGGAK